MDELAFVDCQTDLGACYPSLTPVEAAMWTLGWRQEVHGLFEESIMKKPLITSLCCSLVLSALGMGLVGCATAPTTPQEQAQLSSDSQRALTRLFEDNPGLRNIVDNSYAYVVFPTVGEGAIGIGAAHGQGEAFKGGNLVGYAEMTRVDIGPQIGGQEYAELLVFRTRDAFDKFTNNTFTFAADAAAVILKSGVAAEAKWNDDVAVFQRSAGGLFAGAAIGGQRFTFRAANLTV
jgi:lipid-binding SYLF domain-containing protein